MPPMLEEQEYPGKSKLTRSRSGYCIATLQQDRTASSDEGRKMVQQTHLYVLLPQRPLFPS